MPEPKPGALPLGDAPMRDQSYINTSFREDVNIFLCNHFFVTNGTPFKSGVVYYKGSTVSSSVERSQAGRGDARVNAAEQATNLETASKIATIVNLLKTDFPDARVDLKPWANDPDTRDLIDPDSIDLSFHFPGRSRLFQSRSILLQIRFHQDPETQTRRAIGIDAAGFDHKGKQWRFSTVQDWHFEGENHPKPEGASNLKDFCRKVLCLFNQPDQV